MATDEEQVEALKEWWKNNGTSLIVSVAVVLLGFFGWRQWQSSQEASAGAASELYAQVVTLTSVIPGQTIGDEDLSTVLYVNEQLRSDYDSSIYAKLSALFTAKAHVMVDDLAAAETELNWLLDNPGLGFFSKVDEALLLTARTRLARVHLAKDEAQQALDLLTAVEPGEFTAVFAELEGDAWLALNERDRAIEAYARAEENGAASMLLELKLQSLGQR